MHQQKRIGSLTLYILIKRWDTRYKILNIKGYSCLSVYIPIYRGLQEKITRINFTWLSWVIVLTLVSNTHSGKFQESLTLLGHAHSSILFLEGVTFHLHSRSLSFTQAIDQRGRKNCQNYPPLPPLYIHVTMNEIFYLTSICKCIYCCKFCR